MRTANYTDLRANLKSYIDAVIDDYDTVVINRGNGKGVVMISYIKNGNSISQNEGESIEDFLKRAACTE